MKTQFACIFAILTSSPMAFAAPVDIAIIGDSIPFSAKERVEIGMPLRLEWRLNTRTPGKYSVGSFAIPSTTSAQHLTAWATLIRNRGYEGIVILSGVNSDIADVSGAASWASINQIVTEALSDGLWVVVVTTLPWGAYSLWTAGRQAATDARLSSMRARAGIILVDTYPSFESAPGSDILRADYEDPDHLHLLTTGSNALADAVLAAVP